MGRRCARLTLLLLAAALAACGGPGTPIAPATLASLARHAPPPGTPDIRNIIVVVQENRSFDNLFSGFPNADAPTQGYTSDGKQVPLKFVPLQRQDDCGIGDNDFKIAYNHGKMNGWNELDKNDPLCPYTRVDRNQIAPYWELAKQYTLADKFFSSTHFSSYVEQLYLIAGTTLIKPKTYDIGMPTEQPGNCDAPPGTRTSLLYKHRIEVQAGPYPCFTQFPTMANLLDKAKIGWRYYVPASPIAGWDAFSEIKHVALGKDRKRNIASPSTNVIADLTNGNLAPMSWVISEPSDSDEPGARGGPAWVKAVVDAAKKSGYWKHLAIVVVWAGSGDSFYDNVAPPQLDPMGLGFRVPMIVVSPYAKRGYVSHVQYELGSILKFVEETWNLGSLGATDQRANDFHDIFGG